MYKEEADKCSFRCPKCGGSQSNPTRRQAFILGLSNRPYFYCHRRGCQYGEKNSFTDFLKEMDFSLYQQFLRELREETFTSFTKHETKIVEISTVTNYSEESYDKYLKPISSLSIEHPAKKYMRQRCIPDRYYSGLYYFAGDAFGNLTYGSIVLIQAD